MLALRAKMRNSFPDPVSRESLYKALSGERTPGFDTILKVIRALGLKLHAGTVEAKDSEFVP